MRSVHRTAWAALLVAGFLTTLAWGGPIPQQGGDTPDAFFLTVKKAVTENQPVLVWKALPASYRKDVTDIVHEMAAKLDPQVTEKGVGVARKTVRALREKKDFILGHPMVAMMAMNPSVNMEEIKANWEAVTGALDATLDSDLFKMDALRTVDIEKFLSGSGANLMTTWSSAARKIGGDSLATSMNRVEKMKLTVLDTKEGVAKIRIETEGEPPEEVEMVRVEGCWVPKELADEWSHGVAEMRKNVAEMTALDPTEKTELLATMGAIEAAVDQVLAAKTQEEFDAAIMGILGMFGPMMGGEEEFEDQ